MNGDILHNAHQVKVKRVHHEHHPLVEAPDSGSKVHALDR